jgi:hypothetical protein
MQEVVACGDNQFVSRVLPASAQEILSKPLELESVSQEFYRLRIESKDSSANTSAEPEQTKLPVKLKRGSSVLSSASSATGAILGSGEAAGNGNGDWGNQEVFEPINPTKRANQGKKKKAPADEPAYNISIAVAQPVVPPLVRIPVAITPLSSWEQSCHDMLKKLTRHEFLDLTKQSAKAVKSDFFHPVVTLFPEIAEDYLKKIRLLSISISLYPWQQMIDETGMYFV